MPKELTHFILSEGALENLEAAWPETGKLLRSSYDFYLLGSIIPDTAYYHLALLNKNKNLAYLSEKIHTKGGGLDGGFLGRIMAEGLKGSNEKFAFVCGLISHQWADSLFHPFIVHFTGNYAHSDLAERKKAQARHRFLEGLIDLKIMGEDSARQKLTPASAAARLKIMKSPLSALSFFIRNILPDEKKEPVEATASHLEKVRRFQLRLLSLYGNDYFKKSILFINRLSGNRFSAHAGLLYGDKSSVDLSLLNEERSFKDPWSGQKKTKSITGIYAEAMDRLTNSLEIYGKARQDGEPFSSDLFHEILSPAMELQDHEIREDCVDTDEMDKALMFFLGF